MNSASSEDSEVVQGILATLPVCDLVDLVPGDWESVAAAADRSSGDATAAEIAAALHMMWGTDTFGQTEIRKAMLSGLSDDELQRLGMKHLKNAPVKRGDLVMRLGNLPWRRGQTFVETFARSFGIPRAYWPTHARTVASIFTVEPVAGLPSMREYQERAVSLSMEALATDERAMLQLPTGGGKTRVAVEVCVELMRAQGGDATILWLAHTRELCEQALGALARVWAHKGYDEAVFFRCFGGARVNWSDEERPRFIVGTYSSVFNRLEEESMRGLRDAGLTLTVADEAHKSLARTYSAVMKFSGECGPVLGLTATPGRGSIDENDGRLVKFFRRLIQPISSEDPVGWLQSQGVLSRLVRSRVETKQSVVLSNRDLKHMDQEGDLSGGTLRLLAGNRGRNRVLVDCISGLVAQHHRVLVFSCSVEHSRVLAAALSLSGVRAIQVDGSMSSGARDSAIRLFGSGKKDVLVNFGVLSTGFDEPSISALVISRPTLSSVLYSQMVGRGLRGPAAGGTDQCLLVDVVDNFANYSEIEEVYRSFREPWNTAALSDVRRVRRR